MSILGIGIAVGMLLLTALITFWPLMRQQPQSNRALANRQRERALAYYERVLTNVRDLDEDHATGKISPEEYRYEREKWVERGVRLLKYLDDLDGQLTPVQLADTNDADIDAAIERAIETDDPVEAQTTTEVS